MAQEEATTTPKDRRVLFPSLHFAGSITDSHHCSQNDPNLLTPLRKSSSFDSVATPNLGSSFTTNDEKESPRSVTLINVNCIPIIPHFGLESSEDSGPPKIRRSPVTVDPTSLVIPPFQRTLTPPGSLISQHSAQSVIDTPSYTKRTCTPYKKINIDPAHILQQVMQRTNTSEIVSILRNKKGDVPQQPPLDDTPLRRVNFDARVWVCEFKRDKDERQTTWYTASDMDRFKRNAVERVCSFTQLVPTGTGRLVRKPLCRKAMFSNPALLGDEGEDESAIQRLARIELHSILVVDPHDLCSKLFVKALKQMLPHANVATARSSDDALKRMECCKKPYDLIMVEERLKLVPDAEDYQVSGSAFMRLLAEEASKKLPENRRPVFVGVSAHFEKDKAKLEESGAAFTWPKPPPPLDKTMRDKLLKHILLARGKDQTALKYFQ